MKELDTALAGAVDGAVLVIPDCKEKIETLLGRSVSLSSLWSISTQRPIGQLDSTLLRMAVRATLSSALSITP